jgi:hypothetical protein
MIAMKKLPVENLGFVEIGGVGEMIYRAVRFPEYITDYDDGGEVYSLALPAVNTLYGIQAANYIVIVGAAKPSVIEETDERAMLGRRRLKRKIKNKNRPQLPFW